MFDKIKNTCNADVVVAGGGTAGCAAALSAKEGICVQSLDGRMVRLEMENRMRKLL
jgi:ribulose 1,5-bisphosphate synthetase/thiazole synthase